MELEKKLLTPDEAAAVLSIGRTKCFELMRTGELDSIQIGTARRVPIEAVDEFVGQKRAGGSATGHSVVEEAAPAAGLSSRLELDEVGVDRQQQRRPARNGGARGSQPSLWEPDPPPA